MKKSILILSTVIASIGLTAFTFCDWSGEEICQSEKILVETDAIQKQKLDQFPDLYFGFGSMYQPIEKGKVHSASTIKDLLSEEGYEPILSVESTYIMVIEDGKRTNRIESGKGEILSKDQKKLLRSFDYTSEFIYKAEITQRNNRTGEVEYATAEPHFSVVPEKQALNELGEKAIVAFVKDNVEERMPLIDQSKLKPSKVLFTVTKDGTISNIKLDRTSGYLSLDDIMMDLMRKLPGKWTPAENADGEKVDQHFAFTFGMGC